MEVRPSIWHRIANADNCFHLKAVHQQLNPMNISVIDSITSPGSHFKANEDRIVISNNLFIVLDGATGLGRQLIPSYSSDALWFVEMFSKHLIEIWQRGHDFLGAIGGSIDACISEYSKLTKSEDWLDYQLPSAGMAAIVVEKGIIRAFRLGDCAAYFTDSLASLKLFGSSPIEDLDAYSIRAISDEIRKDRDLKKAREAILPILRKHRSLMNKPEGYGALSLTRDCLRYIESTIVPSKMGAKFLLATDGFSAIESYKNCTVVDFLKSCELLGLSGILEEIREIENHDETLSKHPRLKPHDDATALLIGLDHPD